ncbi:hypothetical protein [Nocardioides gilvus]|uniref:hypothetical protein n=1 Tax=Nocardioides gilvus TaxID=1735589 RepID=UPI000D74DA9E|nr:hypothetical protein [Nocardioides gilvus]
MNLDLAASAGSARWPGLSFEASPAGRPSVLPRLDVTGFVGYAEAGPLDVPVLVHDVASFQDTFGADVVLAEGLARPPAAPARDRDRRVTSLLGPTVRAFFDNGGRACWVVRVAQDASTARFVVPGVVARGGVGDPHGWRAVVFPARSPGAFADDQAVTARVTRNPLVTLPGSLDLRGWVDGRVVVPASAVVGPGDLLEVVLTTGRTLWVGVRTEHADAAGQRTLTWRPDDETWLDPVRDTARTGIFSAQVNGPGGDRTVPVDSYEVDADGATRLTVPLAPEIAPTTGDVLHLEDGLGAPILLSVHAPAHGVPAVGAARSVVSGWPAWRLLDPGVGRGGPHTLARVSVVELGLATRRGDAALGAVDGLGFTDAHPRWVGHLPSDHSLHVRRYRRSAGGGRDEPTGPLDELVRHPRFSAAADGDTPTTCLPLGLGVVHGSAGVRTALVGAEGPRARNGVARRDPDAFLDPALADRGAETLLEAARRRFFVDGLELRGIHALLPLEEVAVLAVPDALHGEWEQESPTASQAVGAPRLTFLPETTGESGHLVWDDPFASLDAAEPADSFVLERCERADFGSGVETVLLGADPLTRPVEQGRCGRWFHRVRAQRRGLTSPWSATVDVPAARAPFDECDAEVFDAPHAVLADLLVTWTGADAPFEIEVSSDPVFSSGTLTHPVAVRQFLVPRPLGATTYVRVRSVAGPIPGAWSNTVIVSAVPARRWLLHEPDGQDPEATLSPAGLAVHRALVVLAAARRDLTLLLSFPRWYGLGTMERHLGLLSAAPGAGTDWAQFHHPWTLTSGEDGVRTLPADGAVAGQMARGALLRGPWIATAGVPLVGAVGVDEIRGGTEPGALRAAGINPLTVSRVGAPGLRGAGVRAWGVDTLAADPGVRPVTVRRLLILLRRLALREGRELVFEPNGPDLRRLTRTRFESALGEMFRLGALAGTRPDQAYRVLCDTGLNPQRVSDAGLLVVELQVAPSFPLEFLVVRLVQSDDGGFRLSEVA